LHPTQQNVAVGNGNGILPTYWTAYGLVTAQYHRSGTFVLPKPIARLNY